MSTRKTGSYTLTTIMGKPAEAFLPEALPPSDPIRGTPELQKSVQSALVALGRLDKTLQMVNGASSIRSMFKRIEAVRSSQIEGYATTLTQLLAYETGKAGKLLFRHTGCSLEAEQVSSEVYDQRVLAANGVLSCVKAMDLGYSRLADMPLSNRVLCEAHEVLMNDDRAGEFRKTQNWIRSSRLASPVFVPPPPHKVADCMRDLENFLNSPTGEANIILKAAMAHVQFETIHPFYDGNGRIGRALIGMMLCHQKVLRDPVLFISDYFMRNREDYYRLLDQIRTEGDWESWVLFFSNAVWATAEAAEELAIQISAQFASDFRKIRETGRAADTLIEIYKVLKDQPIVTPSLLMHTVAISGITVYKALERLIELGIMVELTGRARDQVFAYAPYLDLLESAGRAKAG